MERREVIARLHDIENRYPVNSWQYEGIDVWPIIKKDIFFSWYDGQVDGLKGKVQPVKKNNLLSKSIKTLKSFWAWSLFCMKETKPIQVLYCSCRTFRVDWHDQFINRYYFPLIQKGIDSSFKIIEYGPPQKGKQYLLKREIIFIDQFLWAVLLQVKMKSSTRVFYFEALASVQEALQTIYRGDIKHYFQGILNKNMDVQLAYIKIFERCFKKYKPKESIGLCYYNAQMFAMHFVANRYKIPNYDMQHGGQGPLHPMYSFHNPPMKGYNILPKTFWCWDEASKHNIESWAKMQKFHQVECKGNPWIDFQLDQADPVLLTEKKMILYTIQEESLDPYILDAIRETPQEYVWWLRLHPRKQAAKTAIENQLREIGILNQVEIKQATILSLPILLKSAAVHISKFSGSVIEAAQVGTKTIIIDPIGVETYEDYIQNEDAVVCLEQKPAALLATIKGMIENKEHGVTSKD